MSVERDRTSEPSQYPNGEGCQEPSAKQPEVVQRIGGVSVDGMSGSDAGVSQEISCGVRATGQLTAQAGLTGKAARAAGEVGVSHSSVEARDSTTRASQGEALVPKRTKVTKDKEMAGKTCSTSGPG